MSKKNIRNNSQRMATTLGHETVFAGIMRFTESLQINGNLEGEIISTGSLYIEETAVINANIQVGSIVVAGVVNGNIIATEKLEILKSGKVYGNIRTARLRIADGVVFKGKCEMIRDPKTVDIFSAKVDKLKKTVGGV
ncbi:MAG: polymer-forming cytoskeletal protein [Spirochaetia bacterium]|jgi:cytoskeletal protein CcmA (bactofilin family)|nr:polymer-forming cytoskeletal protein [Spirochaetia bacterium]